MKKIKKIFALMIAMVMVLGMSTSVFATSDASITINRDETYSNVDQTADSTLTTNYTIYKIFDASYDSNTASNTQSNKSISNSADAVSYTIAKTSPWVNVLGTITDGVWAPKADQKWVTLSPAADGVNYVVNATATLSNEESAIEFADWLLANKGDIAGTTNTVQKNDKTTTFSNLDHGYYLIESSVGSNLVLATSNISIVEKNTYPSITKTVADEDNNAQIGDVINYTITVTVPTGADKQIIVTDTMTSGLTFKNINSVTVPAPTEEDEHATKSVSYTANSVDSKTNSFTITFNAETVAANAGKTITISYDAILNAKAVVQGTDANTNTAELQYGNFHSKKSVAGVDTQQITIRKYNGAEELEGDAAYTPIANAVFEVQDVNGTAVKLIKVSATEYRVALDSEKIDGNNSAITADSHALGNSQIKTIAPGTLVSDIVTVANQVITVKGLDADLEYKLVETQAPAGFNTLTTAQDVTITTDANALNEHQIENNQGTVLPSTGGVGTTIFYVIGAILVIGAGVVLVTRRRMNAN